MRQLSSADPNARVRSLQAIAERPIADATLLAECERLLDDREICLVQIPLRFGEVRVEAVGAVAALRHVLGIETPAVLDNAFFPLTVDRVGQLSRTAGIESSLSGPEGTIDKLRQLRMNGQVPTLTIRREPREMGELLDPNRSDAR